MFSKKISVIVLLAISACFSLSFTGSMSKKIEGHWTCENDLYDLKESDTLIFTKTKYTDKLYQWAGALAGIEIGSNKQFSEYHNVLCSSESNPVRFNDETWNLHNDLMFINGKERRQTWRIMNVTGKQLKVLILEIKENEQ